MKWIRRRSASEREIKTFVRGVAVNLLLSEAPRRNGNPKHSFAEGRIIAEHQHRPLSLRHSVSSAVKILASLSRTRSSAEEGHAIERRDEANGK